MESTPEVLTTGLLMTMVAVIIIAGAVSSRIAQRIKLPDVVLYIFAGVILGPNFFNVLNYNNSTVNQVILTFGAAYILFDGGREIRLKVLNTIKYSVTSLATLGVLVSAFITSFFAQKFLHLDPLYAFLLGSVIASTDPSVLVPLFKKMDISPKLKQTIIAESAFNDACGAIVTFAILGIIAGGEFSFATNAVELLKTSIGGIGVGLLIGLIAVFLVTDHKGGILSDFPTEIAVAAVIVAYELGTYLGVSGFMAVFVLGIVAGNKKRLGLRIPDDGFETHIHFKEALISILRMMIFILLGVHMDLAVLSQYWLGSLLTVLALIFVARPISVFVSVIWDKKANWTWQEMVYLMWVRETGVIPAALVGMLVTMKVPHADVISAVTFMTILITLALQASTKCFVARVLKLEAPVVKEKSSKQSIAVE